MGVDTGTCDETVSDGTVRILTATADAGSVFSGWSGCDSPAANVCTQTLGGNETVSPNFITAMEAITALKDGVQALIGAPLKPGQAKGLTRPLNNALRSLGKGKPADACNQLQDFITKVNAKTPTPLDAITAATLIADAEAIRSALGC